MLFDDVQAVVPWSFQLDRNFHLIVWKRTGEDEGILFCGNNFEGSTHGSTTAPHALEPDYPGVRQTVVSLYHTLDGARLRQSSGQVLRLTDEARSLQAQAARELTAAAGLLAENRRTAAALTDRAGVLRCAQRLAAREFPRTGHAPSEQVRLLSAVTPKGIVVFEDTVPALARRIIVLHDEYGAVSRLFLAQLRTSALERGHHILSCRCPLAPDDSWEHLFLPEAGAAVLTSNQRHPFRFEGQKNIHCTRFMDADGLRRRRERLTFGRRAADRLLRETSSFQREAKAVHDRLETLYQQATDFSGVDAVCARLEQELHLN